MQHGGRKKGRFHSYSHDRETPGRYEPVARVGVGTEGPWLVGDPRASDAAIMEWAATHEYVVFTHDLDFGTMLALSHAAGPSVLQVRGADVLPDHLGDAILAALKQHGADLSSGALVVVDESRSRVRVLPIG